MQNELSRLLSTIVRDPETHARMVNTFSYLEYVGFRKIVKSQESDDMTGETLAHAIEEGRHALRLKRFAIKLGGQRFDRYDESTMLAHKDAEIYFQGLDEAVSHDLEGLPSRRYHRLAYLYVTWLVELRALSVYAEFQSAMPDHLSSPLKGILAEEEGHLSSVETELRQGDADFARRANRFRIVEHNLYINYLLALDLVLKTDRDEQFVQL